MIPWDKIIDLLKFLGWMALAITIIKTAGLLLVEVFSKTCRHCGKRI